MARYGNHPIPRQHSHVVGGITPEGFQEIQPQPANVPHYRPPNAPHPTRHSNIGHPNPVHGERPAMLPSHKRGQPKVATPFARVINVVSGVRR